MEASIIYLPLDTSDFNNPINGWLHQFAGITAERVAEKMAERLQSEKKEDALVSPEEGRKLFHPAPCRLTFLTWMRDAGIEEHRIGNRIFYSKESVLTAAKTIKKYKRA